MYGRASGVPAVRRYVAAFFKVCALYGAVYAACALAQTRSSVVSAIATDAPPYTLAVARQSVSARTTRALSPRPRLARANLFLSSSPLLSWRRALARAIFRAVVRSGSLPSCRRRRPRRPSPIPWRRGAHPRVCVCVARPRHASPPHAAAVDALALRRCSGAARALLWRCSGAAAARTRRHHTAHTHTHTHTHHHATILLTVVRTYFVIGVVGLLSQSEALLPAGRLCLRRQIALLGLCVRHPRIELGLLARPLLVPLLPPASRLPQAALRSALSSSAPSYGEENAGSLECEASLWPAAALHRASVRDFRALRRIVKRLALRHGS